MKRMLLGAVAALAVTVPAAQADTTGHIDFSYHTGNIDWGIGDNDIDGWQLGGAVITPLSGPWSLQFDANHHTYTLNDGVYDSGLSNTSVHAIYGADGYRFGGYAGFGSVYSQTVYMLGGEGQLNLSNMSFGGVLQYGTFSDGYGYSAWDARVTGSYFFTPDFALNGAISNTEMEDFDDSVLGLGIGAEYRFANSPFSISGEYLHEDWDFGTSDADADIFRLGVSFDFGSGSLQERAQSGASFDGARRFVEVFSRWD